MRHIAFTGSRKGPTPQQKTRLSHMAKSLISVGQQRGITLHHGGCIGGDEWFHTFCHLLCVEFKYVMDFEVYPSDITHTQAKACRSVPMGYRITLHPSKPALDRNWDIMKPLEGLDDSILIACPDSSYERQRSGTWHTVRCARTLGVGVIDIVLPDGSVELEGVVG